ncbi:MAG TPA: 3-isopropylmalate dehydratase small subunit [Bacteroidia bacterium]|jgi:3-isopropylmalate/(R)-2-methylmalate dehydratase small subunit|nr:3-isopropylmalate dehydratase small subunit [Bacteroidia bacterium]
MEKFKTIQSTFIPLPGDHIDTDQIVPARFLKSTNRLGFGQHLFRDWRSGPDGTLRPDFPLNDPQYRGSVLLTGHNFGCGSSREHAAWALYDYGFRVLISSGFADIFRNNALNNGILPVELPEVYIRQLFDRSQKYPETELIIDLEKELLTLPEQKGLAGFQVGFRVNPYKRHCLLKGLDDIDFLLSIRKETEQYEQSSKYLQLIK